MKLFFVLLAACGASVAFHELLYRRFTPGEEAEYELNGLITHAGIDMVLMALVVCTVGLIYELNHNSKYN